ncbi:MAG: endolytic transglycosylase MltG [Bacteroidales bacterium]|nr:endolytic transglycosylase MltG [Bacteroidales bacterium]
MRAGKILKRVLVVFSLLMALAAVKSYNLYKRAFAPNVRVETATNNIFFYIPTGSSFDSVLVDIERQGFIKNIKSFKWVAHRKNYENHVRPGRYLIKNRMSNNELVNLLRSGKQEPVDLTFNNLRTLEQFAGRVSQQLEFDSLNLLVLLRDTAVHQKYGLNKYTMACMFIPNTYEIYWNTSAEKFLDRMNAEYRKFWNRRRTVQAKQIGKTPEEVITLASIVNEETRMENEKKRVAGVYMNRLNKGMRLQADPTVVFGIGDFSIRRVLKKHYQADSPYNTYKFTGLPPGPICLPDISSIDAVLNYERHDYIYFCARPDFSGYHNFAKTLTEHNKNARAYQLQLNKRRIYN